MTREELIQQIKSKRSFLCIGLDTDINKIPKHLLKKENPVVEFNRQIIEATHDLCIAYKPNTAFYECNGEQGWRDLKQTFELIPDEIFKIADAKRGDIGNTSGMYAKAFYENMQADAVTVSPYMGSDSVQPFLEFKGKWAIILALTSNPGAIDLQFIPTTFTQKKVYEKVLIRSQRWGTTEDIMYVVGATRADMLKNIRAIVPDHFLLIPGVGAQGGSLKEVAEHGMNADCGLIVNSSRSVIYASSGEDFAEKAREEAMKVQKEMEQLLVGTRFI